MSYMFYDKTNTRVYSVNRELDEYDKAKRKLVRYHKLCR